MIESKDTIDLLTAIVSSIETSDENSQKAKSEILEQLKLLISKTDVVSTNFPKLIETLSTFDNKIASSFSNIENIEKRLSVVTNQIKSIENSVLNTQQQSKNLQLDHIIEKLSNADQQAQQLSNHLRNSSTKYLENMNAATNIARKKIEELETEVANIADSFSKIVSTRIADNVVTDVSSRLKNHVFRETVTGIETGAKEVAQTLTNKAFKNIGPTLKHTEETILNDIHSFKKETDTAHQNWMQNIKKQQVEAEAIAKESHEMHMQREQDYQKHVSKEKAAVKRNWIVIFLIAWFGFTATAVGIAYAVKNASESTVNEALGYIKLKDALNNFGFHPENSDYCQSLLAKKQFNFTQGPQVSSCFYLESPTYEYTVNSRNLMIFTK
ncbi:hypothetical protein VXE41_15315 [Acinetobacter variabilis]